jgi:hypothetical protein
MRSSAWLLVVLALLARSAKAQAGGDRDLLASLANAEICPAGAHCLPFQTSRQVHRSQGDAGTVMLPVGAMSNVYLRVPPAASLDLEFASSDSSLAVTAGTDADERVLLRDGSLVEEGRRVTLDLAPWGGDIIRLRFRPQAGGTSPAPSASIRRPVLDDGKRGGDTVVLRARGRCASQRRRVSDRYAARRSSGMLTAMSA